MTANPADAVWDAIYGISRFAALSTMAELDFAAHLRDGPLSADQLAARCEAHPLSVRRVLRELAGMGFVRSVPEGYEVTEAGLLLADDSPGSLRSAIRLVGEEAYWNGMGKLPKTVKSGVSAFRELHGPVYKYLGANPEAAVVFDDYMTRRAIPFANGLADHYDFTGVERVVDVGGGRGHILTAVLAAHPGTRGVLFDLDRVIPSGREAIAAAGLADRCECVVGDFFVPDGIPAGDVYILANVIHNWNDDDSVRILSNIRAAMPSTGKILIVEIVLPDDDSPHVGLDGDMRMLALIGDGMERTRTEYQTLLEKSGLALSEIVELPAWASAVVATPI
ncbi:methyltransferase [Acrocarpospora pleiomorpha]|uniref:Methyltransferase n=1 Tax=Acrocarpospora pleiomorpha TaxID=90975 RepID=A0A5M3XTW4_9ACTN|nr:acetylserotonin O-methyltransferase [Acrocarpospora pleiomorpha]GES21818.1 methyltransferase [Acrocarpospora pleiomorpha]